MVTLTAGGAGILLLILLRQAETERLAAGAIATSFIATTIATTLFARLRLSGKYRTLLPPTLRLELDE